MARVKRGVMTRKRHNYVLQAAKGYWGNRSKTYKAAHEAVMRAGQYAYRDRRVRKRDFRQLWIARINAGCRQHNVTYSRFICGLTRAGVEIDRKMLSELAISDQAAFSALVARASEALQQAAA